MNTLHLPCAAIKNYLKKFRIKVQLFKNVLNRFLFIFDRNFAKFDQNFAVQLNSNELRFEILLN